MTPLGPGLRAAAVAFGFILTLLLIDLFILRRQLIILYPAQLIAYFIVGRVAANMAREEHLNSAQYGMVDPNYSAAGGVGGGALCIMVWVLYGIVSIWLQAAQLGGFAAGFFGWAICASLDLPTAIGLSAWGGNIES